MVWEGLGSRQQFKLLLGFTFKEIESEWNIWLFQLVTIYYVTK